MTVMPFLLIFQLVFSGGFFTLPGWASNLSKLSVSSYGVRCVCAEAAQKPAYEHSRYNVTACWGALILYTLVCSFLSGMELKLIDKDKR